MSFAETPFGRAEDARAVIDIGSNTVRLVVYGAPVRAPTILHNEKVTARLGKNLSRDGLLSEKGQASALAALARYATLLKLAGVRDVTVAATAATRDAGNGPAFLEKVRETTGFAVRQLSGEEEALISARGVGAAFPCAKGIVADLGGGSLELTAIDGADCTHGLSLPLGTLRLPALRDKGGEAFRRKIGAMLDKAGWACEPCQRLYLVGGSLRAFARYTMIRMDWPVDDPHGFVLSPADALEFTRTAVRRVPELPLDLPGISASRVASLPDAAALLGVLVDRLAPAELVFSSWGLREGLLFENATADLLQRNPLIAGAADFATLRGIAPQLATMVAGWTTAANDPNGASAEDLRLAATMLALASARVEPNLRPTQALEWALRKRWIGIDDASRAVLAAAVLANTGRLEAVPALTRLAPSAALAEAQGWGLAIRLCRRFCAVTPQALARSSLVRSGGDLVLSVAAEYAPLVSDSLERDLKALATHLELRPLVRVEDQPNPGRSST